MSPTRPPYPRAHPPSQPHFSVTGHLPCCEGRDPANHNVTRLGGGGRSGPAGRAEEGGAARPAGGGGGGGPAGRAEEGEPAGQRRGERTGRLSVTAPVRPAGQRRKERPALPGSGGRICSAGRLGRLGGQKRSGPAGLAEEGRAARPAGRRRCCTRKRPCCAGRDLALRHMFKSALEALVQIGPKFSILISAPAAYAARIVVAAVAPEHQGGVECRPGRRRRCLLMHSRSLPAACALGLVAVRMFGCAWPQDYDGCDAPQVCPSRTPPRLGAPPPSPAACAPFSGWTRCRKQPHCRGPLAALTAPLLLRCCSSSKSRLFSRGSASRFLSTVVGRASRGH